jgi:hypothetical protein
MVDGVLLLPMRPWVERRDFIEFLELARRCQVDRCSKAAAI